MFKINNILFPTDFSRCADQALNHALFLAKKYGAELHIIHAVVLFDNDPNVIPKKFPELDELRSRLERITDERINEIIKSRKTEKLNLHTAQIRGISAASVILEYASDNDIDLIVMGTQGRRGISHMLLGSVAEEIIRLSICPVLTIRESEKPKSIEAFEKILVPVDFSDYSKESIVYAKEIAQMYEAKLHLLHVIEKFTYPSFYLTDKTPLSEFITKLEKKSMESLEEIVKESVGTEIETEYHVIEGHAAKSIVQFETVNDIDLVVIASHGMTAIEHFVLGSVTEKVVRRSSSPVFTVKPFGKSLL